MKEVITEDAPRIKFQAQWQGRFEANKLRHEHIVELARLASLQTSLEDQGIIPILSDGFVGGNCAIKFSTEDLLLVTKSGKSPGVKVQPQDFVCLTGFDRLAWKATFTSPHEEIRPSSDAPLHFAALADDCCRRYGFSEARGVAVHGLALADGEGLKAAEQVGMPISHEETLFSTPEDLQALEELFMLTKSVKQ